MAQYVTIGTGTANNLYTTRLLNTYYEDSKAEMTFQSTELNGATMPLISGDTIYSIGWYVIATITDKQVMYNANIKFTEGTNTVTVWSGNLPPNDDEWNDILLNQPYVWQGGNLIVEYCFDNCEYTNYFHVRRSNGVPTFDYDYFDDDNGCSITPAITASNRPNTRFGKTVPGATYTNDTYCIGTPTTLSSSSSIILNTSISGFTYYGQNAGSYYFKSTQAHSWLNADLKCQQVGGHLAHISNQAENNYVDDIIGTLFPTRGWIGLHQNCNSGSFSEPSGGWEWTDGISLTYSNWNSGEPNDYFGFNSENYVEMFGNGKWNDHTNPGEPPGGYVLEIEETYLWNTGSTTSSISVNPTVTTTYWVDHKLGTQTTREYFIVEVGSAGCTDPTACNYDPLAICDDGSCLGLWGCMDNTACNYNVLATCDDGSCILPDGCTDNTACNYDPLATCDDGSCVYDVSVVTATNVCTGVCDGEVVVAVSPITPGTNYTYTIDGGSVISYSTNTNGLCVGNHSYEFFIDGISCGVTSIIIGEYPAMTLQTTAVDSTCDSSYAFVSASVASSSTGNVSLLSYCASNPAPGLTGQASTIIEEVILIGDNNDIYNNTSGISDFYEDYSTTMYADITEGLTYSLDISINDISGSGSYSGGVRVFIDFNIDGDFTDLGEDIGIVPTPANLGVMVPISFTVPNTGFYGATRMRVVCQDQYSIASSNDIGSCDSPTGSNMPYFGATEDYSIVLNNSNVNATFLWSTGQITDSIFGLSAGNYSVTITDDNGCLTIENFTILSATAITVLAAFDQLLCEGIFPNPLLALGSTAGNNYSWTPASDFVNATIQNPVFSNAISTTTSYMVTFTDFNGCVATDSVTITVFPTLTTDPINHN
jgi:hypothetical protein